MEKMKIKDINNKDIIVTDLQKAIEQAALYKGYAHKGATPHRQEKDEKLQAYWTDIHTKLLLLKSKTKNKSK